MRTEPKTTKRTRANAKANTARQLERYLGKKALMEMAEQDLSQEETYHRLKREVHKLRQQLVVKGVLHP